MNVYENVSTGTDILSIKVRDADTNEKHTFSIYTSSAPSSLDLFSIESWSGVLRVREPLDHEVSDQHVLVVEVADSRFTKIGRSSPLNGNSSPLLSSTDSPSMEDNEISPQQHRRPTPTMSPFSASSHRAFTRIIINVLDVNDHPVSFILCLSFNVSRLSRLNYSFLPHFILVSSLN